MVGLMFYDMNFAMIYYSSHRKPKAGKGMWEVIQGQVKGLDKVSIRCCLFQEQMSLISAFSLLCF